MVVPVVCGALIFRTCCVCCAAINIDTQLSSSDGQSVLCRASNCPADQAYNSPTDFAADRNSALGQTFTHTFCP